MKVAVVGANGQAGTIHCNNLKELDADIMAVTSRERPHKTLQSFSSSDDFAPLVSQGFKTALIAIPDTKLNPMARKAIDSGFSRLLVEKPASMNSSELIGLKDHADKHNCEVMIGYQRKYDPVFADKLAILRAKYNEGYRLDHTTVHSCDARQPP